MASFFQLKLKKIRFNNCKLQEVDFAETDLSKAVFNNCELNNALFDKTILEKADLRTAHHYTINPENNRIKKARFSISGIAGLLNKYQIQIEK